MRSHDRCLAIHFLKDDDTEILPTAANCPVCEKSLKWYSSHYSFLSTIVLIDFIQATFSRPEEGRVSEIRSNKRKVEAEARH